MKTVTRQKRSRSTKIFIYPVSHTCHSILKHSFLKEILSILLMYGPSAELKKSRTVPEGDRGSRSYRRRVEIRVSSEIWTIICEQRARQLGRFGSNGAVEEEGTAGGSL